MMDSESSKNFAIFLGLIWICYAVYVWLFWLNVPNNRARSRFNIFVKIFSRRKTLRLCAYHTSVALKVGQMALLDVNNCDLCGRGLKGNNK